MHALARRQVQSVLSKSRAPVWMGCCRLADSAGGLSLQRCSFSNEAASKLKKVLKSEIDLESSQYRPPPAIDTFLKSKDWKLEEKDGEVNMVLSRKVGDKVVIIDFQLTSPYTPPLGPEEGEEGAEEQEDDEGPGTDFTLSIEKSDRSSGVTFYCSTQNTSQSSSRFVIGNIRSWKGAAAKESPTGYNGPEFEDLDDNLQNSIDEYLAAYGISEELADMIDACAMDKEQREYMVWLKAMEALA
eukprot:Filipodium_phascolosomae@DN947_c0_g1_i1.p1